MGSILIVDDSPEELAALRAILVRDGYEVRSLQDGETALANAVAQPPDLILLDIMMAGLNGYELCQRLKDFDATRDIPVLFLSGLDDPDSKVHAFEAGGVDFISKPFHAAEIRARVRNQLALREAQRQLAAQNAELRAGARLQADVERMLRHDLRVSLAGVIGFSELIAEELHPAHSSAAHARIVASAGYSMLSMVHGSFDLLKMERGAYVLQAEPFDVTAVARQVMAEHSLAAQERDVRVRLELGEDCEEDALVSGERLLTHSLFNNLLRNALEASPKGGEIRFHFCMNAGRTVTSLRNAGAVPETIRDRFFERYTTAGKAGGSGLGTYSARLMAETQHGSIRLDPSEPGFTTVRVELPAPAPEEAAKFRTGRDGPPSEAAQRFAASDQPKPAVLVADDDAANRAYLKRILQGLNVEIILAVDGSEALAVLQERPFAAALLDVEMPGLKGPEIVREFRSWQAYQSDRFPGPLIIALTGHQDAATRDQCAAAGFDRVLTKPISKRRLQEEILNAVCPGRQVVQLDAAIRDLIPEFLAGQQAAIEECETAVAAGNGRRVRSIAHRLQGSFAMYGFGTASAISSNACDAARTGNLALAATLIADLRNHLLQLEIRYG